MAILPDDYNHVLNLLREIVNGTHPEMVCGNCGVCKEYNGKYFIRHKTDCPMLKAKIFLEAEDDKHTIVFRDGVNIN